MRWPQWALFAGGALARHEHHQLHHQHQHGALVRRQDPDIPDDPLDTCPDVEDVTVELSPVSYTQYFPYNTIVDPLLNGILLTITNAPIEITITGFLTITRGPSKTTTTTTPRRTSAATTTTRRSSVITPTSSRPASVRSSSTASVPRPSSSSPISRASSISVSRASTASLSGASTASLSRASSGSLSAASSGSASSPISASSASGGSSTVSLSSTATFSTVSTSPSPPPNGTYFISSTILVIVRNPDDALSATSGLNGYGIPFEVLTVPKQGVALPTLNTTFGGNYGGIIITGQVSYDYGVPPASNFQSALTAAQYQQLYDYQTQYGVRMVQYDVFPGPAFGATSLGSCCAGQAEQLFYFTQTTPQSGINLNADMTTAGLFHYIGQVTDPSTTTEIARFRAAGSTPGGTAAVINNFAGREQMVFFISFGTAFSPTSNLLGHEFITWMTRGLYAGYRRVYFQTQIDDMFLSTPIYPANTVEYRLVPADMQDHWNWVPTINAKMNPGSSYFPEVGHNGNGNIDFSTYMVANGDSICAPGSIQYDDQPATPLEFVKPLGTGRNYWPTTPTVYGYSSACNRLDPLYNWWATKANQDRFMHISHTFTHLGLNNATYSDALKEIQFNQAWLQAIGFTSGRFTANGLIPPAITGLHNGDVLRAWTNAGLRNCVGDNTRNPLRNPTNQMWPYTTTVGSDGFDGYLVIPRWATRIYYNCDSPTCTTLEWINTSAGSGTFYDLLAVEKADTMRHLFGLYHEGYMFHQANLRTQGVDTITINGVTARISIFQAWVETIVQEFVRLVNWPMITLNQADLAVTFTQRQARDACQPRLTWTRTGNQITGATITANGNVCSAPIPFTIPKGVQTDTQGFTTEQFGNDAQTIFVTLSGAPVSFSFSTPISA